MAQEALAHPGGLRPGTAPAQPLRGGGRGRGGGGHGGGGRHGHRGGGGGGRRVRRLGRRGGVGCPCGQWSRSHPGRATLVRHVLLKTTAATAALTASRAALAPPPRPLRVGKSAAPRPLVSTCAVAPSRIARQAPARPAAVAVASVAVAAQHDLGVATRTQEQAPRSLHAHPGQEPKMQCWTDASQRCHTDAAPPSSARCRARYGRRASRPERPLPRPPSSAWTLLYPERRPVPRVHRRSHNLTLIRIDRVGMAPTESDAPARPPCRAAGQAQSLQLPSRSAQDQFRRLTSE